MTNLQAIRKARELSREGLARLADCSAKTIEAHEYGVNNDVLYSVATTLARKLGVKLDALFLPKNTGVRIGDELTPALEPRSTPLENA